MKDDAIDLWTERGISYREVRKRLPERSREECLMAAKWLFQWRIIQTDVGEMIAEMADRFRSSEAILRIVEPTFDKAFTASGIKFPPEVTIDMFKELHALAVEGYVREADSSFPIHGRN